MSEKVTDVYTHFIYSTATAVVSGGFPNAICPNLGGNPHIFLPPNKTAYLKGWTFSASGCYVPSASYEVFGAFLLKKPVAGQTVNLRGNTNVIDNLSGSSGSNTPSGEFLPFSLSHTVTVGEDERLKVGPSEGVGIYYSTLIAFSKLEITARS